MGNPGIEKNIENMSNSFKTYIWLAIEKNAKKMAAFSCWWTFEIVKNKKYFFFQFQIIATKFQNSWVTESFFHGWKNLEKSHLYSKSALHLKIRQSKINSRWVAGPIGQRNRRPSVWCSKYYFFYYFFKKFLPKSFQFISLFFYNFIKNKNKEFWVP